MLRTHDLTQKNLPTYLHTYSPTYLPCDTRQSCRLVTIETLITILTIENLNSWQSLLPDNQEWQWTAFAILAMFFWSSHDNICPKKKLSILGFGLFWNCLSQGQRKVPKLLPGHGQLLFIDPNSVYLLPNAVNLLQCFFLATNVVWAVQCNNSISSTFFYLPAHCLLQKQLGINMTKPKKSPESLVLP